MELKVIKIHATADGVREEGTTYEETNPDFAKSRIDAGLVEEVKIEKSMPGAPEAKAPDTKPQSKG